MNPYKYLIVLALFIGLVSGCFLTGYKHGLTVKQGEWNADILAQKRGQDAALKAAAEAIAKIEVKSEQIIQPLRTEIRTNTVYRDCMHSDLGLRNLNALITGLDPITPGGDIVPGAKPPH